MLTCALCEAAVAVCGGVEIRGGALSHLVGMVTDRVHGSPGEDEVLSISPEVPRSIWECFRFPIGLRV